MSDEAEKLARRVRDALGVHNDDDSPVTELVRKLASRAAPQPPAEAQPVACSKCGVRQPLQHSPDCGRTPPSAPVGAAEDMVLDAIERRESSAPVGVEDGVFSPMNACCYREQCRANARALAQQPAAVDDAADAKRYRALVACGKFLPSEWPSVGWAMGCGRFDPATKKELDAAADALAAQQGGAK